MEEVGIIKTYKVCKLTKEITEKHVVALTKMANQIPLVDYTEEQILAERKEDRVFHGKWEHSFIVFDGDKPIAFIIGYEREAEGNNKYPENSLYISELGVLEDYQRQGIGRNLVGIFLDKNNKLNHLKGDIIYSIQTNSADINKYVQDLYKSFGFKQTAYKEYDNRRDVVMVKKG